MDNSRAVLQAVVQGQAERNVLPPTIGCYLSKMKVMGEMLNKHEDIRRQALVLDERGLPVFHTGKHNLLV